MDRGKNYLSIYLRSTKDKDIIEYLDNIDGGERSREIRDLIREGIKSKNKSVNRIIDSNRNITDSNRNVSLGNINNIKIEKKNVEDALLEKRLDEL